MDSSNSFQSIDEYQSSTDSKSHQVVSFFTFPRCSLRREHLAQYNLPYSIDNSVSSVTDCGDRCAEETRDKLKQQSNCSSASKKGCNSNTGKHKSTHKANSIETSRKKKFTRAVSSSLTSSTSSSSSSSSSSSDVHPTPAFLLKSARDTSRLKEKNNLTIRTQLSLLHESELFADLIIHCNNSLIKRCHSTILYVRSANFLEALHRCTPSDNIQTVNSTHLSVSNDNNVNLHLLPEFACRSTKFINLPSQVNKQIIQDLIENIYCSSEATSSELEVQTINHLKSFQSYSSPAKSQMDVNTKAIALANHGNIIQCKSFNSDIEGNREDSGFSSQSARDDSTTEDEMPRPRGLVRSNTFDLICKQTDVDLADINCCGNSIGSADNAMVKSEILPSGRTYSSQRSSSARAKSTCSRKNKSDLMRKCSLDGNSYPTGGHRLKRPPFVLGNESESSEASSTTCQSPRSIFQFFVDMDKLPQGVNGRGDSSYVRCASQCVTNAPDNCHFVTGENVTRSGNSCNDNSASAISNCVDDKLPGLICLGESMKREEISSHASSLQTEAGGASESPCNVTHKGAPHPIKLKNLSHSTVNDQNNLGNDNGRKHSSGGLKSHKLPTNDAHDNSNLKSIHCSVTEDETHNLHGNLSSNVLVVMDDRLTAAKNFSMGKSLVQSASDDCEPMTGCMSRSYATGAIGAASAAGGAVAAEKCASKLPSASKFGHRSRISSHHRSGVTSAMSTSWTQETRSVSSASSIANSMISCVDKRRGESPAGGVTSSTADLNSSIYLPSNELSSFMMKSRSSNFSMDRSVERSSNCNSPSSMMSSMSRSILRRSSSKVRNSKLDEERISRTFESVSKLGDDLLKMFINQVNPDLTIECIPEAVQVMDVSTNTTTIESSCKESISRIKAHKCILATRSPYFNAMFTGNWMEKSSSVVQMVGFSYDVVYYALCHLYSGTIMLPTNIEISEIALISDLLGLTTLRDTVIHELKMTFCHFFHKPCKECSIGVLDCLVLSHTCQLWDLKGQCLSWLGKHWTRIWPTKPFASLSQYEPLHDECYMATLETVTVETAIDTILSCERLLTTMPRVKWAESVFNLVNLLTRQCTEYITDHFDSVLSSKSFISLSRGRDWNVQTIEEPFITAISAINCETGCKSLVQLTSLVEASLADTGFGNGPYTESFSSLIRKLFRNVERFLIHNADHAITCSSWNLLSNEAKVRIRESAVMVYEFDKPHAPKPMLSSSMEKSQSNSRPNTASPSLRRKNSAKKVSGNHSGSVNCDKTTGDDAVASSDDKSQESRHCVSSPTSRRKVSSKMHSSHRSRNETSGGHSTGKLSTRSSLSANDSTSATATPDHAKSSETAASATASHGKVSSRIPLTSLANTSVNSVKRKSSQVAKVSPFNSRKISTAGVSVSPSSVESSIASNAPGNTDDSAQCSASTDVPASTSRHDLVNIQAEMDAQSNLVQNCLAEAQHLEQELSRKLKQYQTRVEGKQVVRSGTPSASSLSSSNRIKPSSNVTASPSRSIRPKSSANSSSNASQSKKSSSSNADCHSSSSARQPSK